MTKIDQQTYQQFIFIATRVLNDPTSPYNLHFSTYCRRSMTYCGLLCGKTQQNKLTTCTALASSIYNYKPFASCLEQWTDAVAKETSESRAAYSTNTYHWSHFANKTSPYRKSNRSIGRTNTPPPPTPLDWNTRECAKATKKNTQQQHQHYNNKKNNNKPTKLKKEKKNPYFLDEECNEFAKTKARKHH